MPITPDIQALIDRLNQELDQIEQQATEGLLLVRRIMSFFPDNARLIQFFAYLSSAILFVETYKRLVQTTVDIISVVDVTNEEIQESGEDLGTVLGQVLETKIGVRRIITLLEELQSKNYQMKRHYLSWLHLVKILNRKPEKRAIWQQK